MSRARELDDTLRRLAAMDIQSSLLIGRGLNLIDEKDGFIELGYSTKGLYALEGLGLKPGYCSQRASMQMLLRDRPHLRQLLLTAQVSFSAVRALLPRTTAVGEEVWAALVKRKTVDEIKAMLQAFDAAVERESSRVKAAEEPTAAVPTDAADDASAAEGDAAGLPPETRQQLDDLARRCVETPGGVAGPKGAHASLEDRPRGRWVELEASPALAAEYDVTLETVRREVGSELTDGECIDLICGEYLSGPGAYVMAAIGACERRVQAMGHGASDGASDGASGGASGGGSGGGSADCPGAGNPSDGADPEDLERRLRDEERARRAAQQSAWNEFWDEARQVLADFTHHWDALNWDPVEIPSDEGLAPTLDMSCKEIDERLVRIVAVHRRCRTLFRQALTAFAGGEVYRKLGFTSMEHYVTERLPDSYDDVKLLIRLQRGLFGLELIRKALDEDRLTQSRALLLIEIATSNFEGDWLQHALVTTVKHLEQDVERAERLKSRDPELFALTGGVPALWRGAVAAQEGESGTPTQPTAAEGENGTPTRLTAAEGENGTPTRPTASEGENGTPTRPTTSEGENGTPTRPTASQGENGTPTRPTASEGENGTPTRPTVSEGENGTKPRTRRANRPLPLPSFRDQLKLILGGLDGTIDGDPFTGLGRRIRLYLDSEQEEVFRNACIVAYVQLGDWGGLAQFLEVMLDHFLEQYGRGALAQIRKHPIIARDEACCAVPTCRRRGNLHVHHIVFRSRGGSEVSENKITLCAAHHLRGVHLGYIRVVGTAPDDLEWELGVLPDGSIVLEVVGRTIVHETEAKAA